MGELVSVVVPCRNEENHIALCLDSLLANDHPQKEILVVDGMSTDHTRSVVSQYVSRHDNVGLLDNPAGITAAALNTGIHRAAGTYIMVAGAHASFPPHYISTLLKYLQESEAVGVGGSMVTRANGGTIGHSIARVLSNKVGVGNSLFRLGAGEFLSVDTVPFGIYHRRVFEQVGGYDERLVRNQDIEFSRRVTRQMGPLYLVPRVACCYYFKGKYGLLGRSNLKNGLWNVFVAGITRRLSAVSPRHFVPLLAILLILATFFLGWWVHETFWMLLAAMGAGYLSLVLLTAIRINNRRTSIPAILWAFIVLHFSYGLGSLLGVLALPWVYLKRIITPRRSHPNKKFSA